MVKILVVTKKEEIEYEILSNYMKPVYNILSKQWQKTQDELKRREEATLDA